jgi:adenine-specific DNA-methyltransferase
MHNEKIFTPNSIVHKILDMGGYDGANILKKHVMDNSCGMGAFIVPIVRRYLSAALTNDVPIGEIISDLETYIHAIEKEKSYCDYTIQVLNDLVKAYLGNDYNVSWDIINGDTTELYRLYVDRMDFVFANPPYCKVHDFGEDYQKYKSFDFVDKGMSDLYIVFFELGIKMLCKNGVLGYITPSSWLTSIAGQKLRTYINYNNMLWHYLSFGSDNMFDKVSVYTGITILKKNSKHARIKYTEAVKNIELPLYSVDKNDKGFSIVDNYAFTSDECYIDGCYYFVTNDKPTFKKIRSYNGKSYISVRNGFATLNDKLFNQSDVDIPYGKNFIPCVKASKSQWTSFVFPYNTDGSPMEFNELDESIQNLLINKAIELKIDTNKSDWYLYGRTQAISHVNKPKISISNIIKNAKDLKPTIVASGSGVYSGLYIVSEDDDFAIDDEENQKLIEKILMSPSLITYVKSLAKYKGSNYYAFSSKDMEIFLNYNIAIEKRLKSKELETFENFL